MRAAARMKELERRERREHDVVASRSSVLKQVYDVLCAAQNTLKPEPSIAKAIALIEKEMGWK